MTIQQIYKKRQNAHDMLLECDIAINEILKEKYKEKLIIIKGDEQRIGQKIFNFLSWLKTEKDIGANKCGVLADPFYISDDKIIKYWNEYNEYN
jgi:hypothetical protein